jgi:hypothetical protein
MTRSFLPVLLGAVLLPALAQAQALREGNIWDFKDHQPTAGEVQSQEKSAGVGPSQGQARHQQDELDVEGRQLLERAARGRQALPGNTDIYGVQPGGVVPISPAPP